MAHFDGQAYEKLLLISAATTIPPYLVAEPTCLRLPCIMNTAAGIIQNGA